ncbi:RND family efflux transporter MFP subunit [Gloeomargarita lithophora Alchichica-D10]|uniref:RND family efflux transporter MFP subunit n=1 Tax=Gloeomargarita lithophora Alchichica-D10 TaxID=1188229 RepID=A0A1J0ACD0_9CYAN|nr:efflux RND transporter periplasmic adaptor subunit [Gloeomargarita lithophora]APB33579.1 RND family efflux transporter MFP subunit [Gloeomargarita lithophora Alchichica-D10]
MAPVGLVGKTVKGVPRWMMVVGVGVLLLVGGAVWVGNNRQRNQLDLSTLTVPVTARDLTVRIPASGKVEPDQRVNLSPKVSGQLVALYVEQGDRVSRGQVIARMDDAELQARKQQTLANLTQAEARLLELKRGNRPEEIAQVRAQVAAARSRYELARQRRQRNQELLTQGAIAQDTLDAAITEEATAEATLKEAQRRLDLFEAGTRVEAIAQAQAQVAAAQAQLSTINVQISDTVIRAPFAGVITQKYASVGAFVTPSSFTSATSSATSSSIVALASELEVIARVAETDISQIRQGQMVAIQADAYPGENFQGRVNLIAPEAVVEQNVTFFEVRVQLLTGQNRLRSGMNVDVVFIGEKLPQTLTIPTASVVTERGKTGVLVPDAQGKPQFQSVVLGVTLNEYTQVLQGLQSGERVFVDLPKGTVPENTP